MKTFKSFLTEADTSGATNTEMAICYQYNMLKFNDHDKALTKAGITEDKFEKVTQDLLVIGQKVATQMKDRGSHLVHSGSGSGIVPSSFRIIRELLNRIEKRTKQMLKEGAIQEVVKFNRLKIKKENSANKVIGINEIYRYLNGELSLKETKEIIFIKTRQYAKRQTTWARGQMKSWLKVNPKDLNLLIKKFK